MNRLHDDEVDIDADLARHLVDSQFPQYAGLPLVPVDSSGTVNVLFRLGDDLCVRLPRTDKFAAGIEHELAWLPRLAPHVSLTIPRPVAVGCGDDRFPFTWSILEWIEGAPCSLESPPDQEAAALALGRFVSELRRIDTAGAPRSTRDAPLALRDVTARRAIGQIDEFDPGRLETAWQICCEAPAWSGDDFVWTHADLLPSNLLIRGDDICAVIDFGIAGVGDPALDVSPAWTLLSQRARETFRTAIDTDDGTWARGRGLALLQALLIVPYYRESNPRFAASAIRTIGEILVELS